MNNGQTDARDAHSPLRTDVDATMRPNRRRYLPALSSDRNV
jgi:hypothetical protein